MNKFNKFLAFALVMLLASCEAFVNKVDEVDPTLPTDANASLLLTGLIPSYAGALEGDLTRIAGIWSGQFSGADRQYSGYQQYINTAGDFDAQWGNLYSGVVQQTRILQKKATVTNNRRMKGVAQVIEAHVLGMAAATWGDIPFTQAADYDNFPNPAYEPQKEVYAKVIALLNDAVANLGSGVGSISGDALYGGSSTKWIMAAHSLHAKYYLHLGDYTNALAHAKMGITSPANELKMPHGQLYGQDFNIWYSFLVYDRAGYMGANAFAANRLHPNGSNPRDNDKTSEWARGYYTYIDDENYVAGFEPNFYSEYDWGAPDGLFGTETYYDLISFRENHLIITECELRLGSFDNALAALNAYRAWMADGGYINPVYAEIFPIMYDAYVDADFAAGGMENEDGTLTASEALYREIIEEKYVSLVGQLEVYNDIRRRGIGSLANKQNWQILGITPNTGTDIPQRFLYSQNEVNANSSLVKPIPGLYQKTEVFK